MRVSHESYIKYIDQINSYLKDEEIFAPVLLNYETLLFPIVKDSRKSLVVSLNHKTPLIYLVEDDRFHSSFEDNFYLKLKKILGRVQVNSISLSKKDNIVTLKVASINEFEDSTNYNIFIELIPTKPNIIICDENNQILEVCYKDKIRNFSQRETYTLPVQKSEPKGEIEINEEFIKNHYLNELENRRQEKYKNFLNFINGKIKLINRKIKAIDNDVKLANESLKFADFADEILCLGLNLKDHLESVEISSGTIVLDKSKTVLENVNSFYKRSKKAKETISRSDLNIKNAKDEIAQYEEILNNFNNASEKEADKLMDEIGMTKKKKEVKETAFNRPYKLNYNGTIIYFGRNANQNDYLSFVMKLNREFIWLHIKDKSGAHLVIANPKPTEKELIFAAEISLICSHATSGEVIYAIKKNVRRGHVLGEALLKNYSVIKLNNVSKETKEAFLKAERIK